MGSRQREPHHTHTSAKLARVLLERQWPGRQWGGKPGPGSRACRCQARLGGRVSLKDPSLLSLHYAGSGRGCHGEGLFVSPWIGGSIRLAPGTRAETHSWEAGAQGGEGRARGGAGSSRVGPTVAAPAPGHPQRGKLRPRFSHLRDINQVHQFPEPGGTDLSTPDSGLSSLAH